MNGEQTRPGVLQHITAAVSSHIIVPAAIIVMVSAFLFFLLDVRSVILGEIASLKRVGFFFVTATVLIARYGTMYEIRKRQGIYTAILALATLRAMMIYSAGAENLLANVIVIFLVWRFATRVTNSLNIDEDELLDVMLEEQKLYGLERLKHEAVEKKHGVSTVADKLRERKKRELDAEKRNAPATFLGINWSRWSAADLHGNPSAGVARLAMMAILVFAMGEPVLLSGPPETGQRALAAVIVFLLGTGVVLAAASAMGTYRHTRKSGVRASIAMVPLKIVISLFLLIIVLAAGLGVPGLQYKGTGEIQPDQHTGTGNVSGKEENRGKSNSENKNTHNDSEESSRGKKSQQGQQREQPSGNQNGGGAVMNALVAMGKLLIVPLVILFIVMAIYGLVKLWPVLKNQKLGVLDRLRDWLRKLRHMMKRREKVAAVDGGLQEDPLKLLARLPGLQPYDAIAAAYLCLTAFIQQLGYQRQPRLTPYEFLSSLPERLDYLREPASEITRLYVGIAYSGRTPTDADAKEMQTLIFKLQQLIRTRQVRE